MLLHFSSGNIFHCVSIWRTLYHVTIMWIMTRVGFLGDHMKWDNQSTNQPKPSDLNRNDSPITDGYRKLVTDAEVGRTGADSNPHRHGHFEQRLVTMVERLGTILL